MTERYEITTILQRELARMPDLFGALEKGTPDQPAVVMESVHHFFKEVAGKPLTRPAWFFDVRQQGEAIPDVGTHLVDAVQWECFPDQALDWHKDVHVLCRPPLAHQAHARAIQALHRRSTITPITSSRMSAPTAPSTFSPTARSTYTLRGVHAKVSALWKFEAPPGAGDTHYALLRGTRCHLLIKQGAEQNYQPALYVENKSGAPAAQFEQTLRAAVAKLKATWPWPRPCPVGAAWEIIIPEKIPCRPRAALHPGHREVPALPGRAGPCPPGKCPT